MQFVTNGPEIPDALLQAHEDGRVVFFCGAGISYPAGLPGFGGLVDKIYELLGTSPSAIEADAYGHGQFDATLDLLERRLPGQRAALRTTLMQALRPNLRRRGATDTHTALLQLSRAKEDGAVRLITTNFDRVFEQAGKRSKLTFNSYVAPMLPIPKNSRWNGLVYLHGALPKKPDASELNRLVLTSGDFGLAYLTERWASRFVSELFRNYVVCFVGYSINDPVLRYMMDALAADRMLGEVTLQAYALGDCEPGKESSKLVEWEAKGVTPILYEMPPGTHDHSALHKTLKAWGETYRDGILGKERIVVDYALTRPSGSTRQDDFVGRLLWALSHESGLPAKRFAEFNPVPSLDWLAAISEARYLHPDLVRFGVSARASEDLKLKFSLAHRPTPYTLAPWMALVSGGIAGGQWDNVMFQLARWLSRHLNDPELVIWLAQKGGQLHERWVWMIEHELDRFARLPQEGRAVELEEIRAQAPNAIPGPLMQTLWRLVLAGRIKSPWRDLHLYRWKDRLKRDGLTPSLRLDLRDLLAPKVTLSKRFRWPSEDESTEDATQIRHLVHWELELAADHVASSLRDTDDDVWKEILPTCLDDFQQLLRDALDLLRELGGVDERSDQSHWDLPSISPHWQNRGFKDWVALIELLRDAWLATLGTDPKRAIGIAQTWFGLPYSTFKRLALFAASQNNYIRPEKWCEWLFSDGAWWLWSIETKREVARLLVLQGRYLAPLDQEKLETAILAGPPRAMYRADLDAAGWDDLVVRSIWLYLAKLNASGVALGPTARTRLDALSIAHPKWQLSANERDEFSHWMSGTGDPDYEDNREVDIAPRRRQELTRWLKRTLPEKPSPFHEDTWREVCRTRFFHSLLALSDLAVENQWPAERWKEALSAWSEEGLVLRAWHYAAPLAQNMPDSVLQELAHGVAWWLEAASKSINRHEDILLTLSSRLLALPLEPDTGIYRDGTPMNKPVTDAINHPIGQVTQALLNLWFSQKPNDNDLLPPNIEPLFTSLCDVHKPKFRHGRVLLASRMISLFRVDRAWTDRNLIPLFDWIAEPGEARAVWEGFLWSPRLYRPLLIAIKEQFLKTADHYMDLGDHADQYASFLTYAALEPLDGYELDDFRSAISVLPPEGLQQVARSLTQALEGAAEQREDYWRNRVEPFWRHVWPKLRDLTSNEIAESLAHLCIAARGEFPAALAAVLDWLKPVEHPHYVVHLLQKSGLSSTYAADALDLLSAVIDDQTWPPRELRSCLEAIAQSSPKLREDHRYQRLDEYARRHGD
jgi:hypothetical protein